MTTKWKLLAAAVAVALPGLSASAEASSCSQVKDHDQRQVCRAVERQSSASCATIKDADERQLCRARTR